MHSRLAQAIDSVTKAAEADATGKGQKHVELLESIHKLNLAAEAPPDALMRMRFEPLQSACIRMAMEMGVLEAIGTNKGQPVTARALSKTTGYDTLLITRTMRLVTYVGVCDEVGESEYGANETTHLINTPAMSGAERHHFDLFFPIGAVLPQYVRETGVHQFPKSPEEKSPFYYAHKIQFWEFFDRSPKDRKDFDDYMEGRRKGLTEWHATYPFSEILGPEAKRDSNAVLLVDVGGNKGHEVSGFHKAYPDIPGRLILQDLPAMIDRVAAAPPPDIELVKYDFFTPQPVQGARAYYMRNICHDWSDEQCHTILRNTAEAMEKGYSRLLIDDYVLPNTGAPVRGSSMDMLMMMYASGMERTLSQWEKILDSSGLEIIKIWGMDSDYEQVIETQLKT